MNRYGPVVQTRSRGPPFRIPSSQVGYGWGLGVPGMAWVEIHVHLNRSSDTSELGRQFGSGPA